MDLTVGVWIVPVATIEAGVVEVGVEGVGWVSTFTLYLLLAIMVLLLLSGTFVVGPGDFLTKGLVLGWADHGWVCCEQVCCDWDCCGWVWGWGLDFRLSLPSNFKYVFIFQMREVKGQSFVLQGLHLITWDVLSLLNM